jgi:hypothetical protein
MKTSMGCKSYTITREVGNLVRINADFILYNSPYNSVEIAELLSRVETMFSGKIDLVRADAIKPRCFYCGSLNDETVNQCSQCGAPI